MSTTSEIAITSERVCYLHCTFCNTVLAVSVPCSSMISRMVTVRCGHCSTLLSVDMGALLQTLPPQDPQKQSGCEDGTKDSGSSSRCSYKFAASAAESVEQQPRISPIPPEKRQRVPSAYNRFIKEEIQRIKARNPDISHREAFSTAAKNRWIPKKRREKKRRKKKKKEERKQQEVDDSDDEPWYSKEEFEFIFDRKFDPNNRADMQAYYNFLFN